MQRLPNENKKSLHFIAKALYRMGVTHRSVIIFWFQIWSIGSLYLIGNHVRFSVIARQHSVCFGIVVELFVLALEFQVTTQLIGNIGDQGQSRGIVTFVDVAV